MATTPRSMFGAQLRRHRLAAGLTQEGLAERAGLSARGIQDIERGVNVAPRAETIRLLAEALALNEADHAELIAAARPELVAPIASHLRLIGPPAPPAALVGREREVIEACALLRPDRPNGARLLTLTGPGGVGKTRLSLAVGAALAGEFADGGPGSTWRRCMTRPSSPAPWPRRWACMRPATNRPASCCGQPWPRGSCC